MPYMPQGVKCGRIEVTLVNVAVGGMRTQLQVCVLGGGGRGGVCLHARQEARVHAGRVMAAGAQHRALTHLLYIDQLGGDHLHHVERHLRRLGWHDALRVVRRREPGAAQRACHARCTDAAMSYDVEPASPPPPPPTRLDWGAWRGDACIATHIYACIMP